MRYLSLRRIRPKKVKTCAPEMCQAQKVNICHFGMKAHAGVGAKSALTHAAFGIAANISHVVQTHEPVHGGI